MEFSRKAITRAVVQRVFDRHMKWRLAELLAPAYPVVLEYPIRTTPRYGEGKPPHGPLHSLLSARHDFYRDTLLEIGEFAGKMASIPEETADAACCRWRNDFFSAMDAIALYGIIASKRPARYMEIGSGNSTAFAHRAINDLGLPTRITSIDPSPRAEIDSVCHRVIRQPLEDVDPGLFGELEAGDVLFIDNSHRVFQNSDASVVFLDILPALKPGILVHLHDIFLPFDYPSVWASRHYSEQYLLAVHLLAGSDRAKVVLPLAYLSHTRWATEIMDRTWSAVCFQRSFAHYRKLTGGYSGVSFWMYS